MPKAKTQQSGLLDTWVRKNRKLTDIACAECGNMFRPCRKSSRYCSRYCSWKNNGKNQKTKSASWWIDKKGYITGRVWVDGKRVNYRYHRWIMEQHIGRKLSRQEVVHHKNGHILDNRIENLKIMAFGKHSTYHNLQTAAIAKATIL